MKRKTFLLGAVISFLCGVFVMDVFRTPMVFIGCIFFIIGLLFSSFSWRVLCIWAACFLLGGVRLLLGIHQFSVEHVGQLVPQNADEQYTEMQGVIQRFPEERMDRTRVYLRAEYVIQNERKIKVVGDVMANLPAGVKLQYGDRVHISGVLKRPFVSEEFNYQRYLEKEGVYVYFSKAYAKVIERDDMDRIEYFWKQIFQFRKYFEQAIRAQLPEPEASYGIGILLGAEYGIPEDIIEEFNTTGLRHLLALSGFNITILIVVVFWVFRVFPKRIAIFFALLTVMLFVIMTGASSSVVRAAVMGSLALFILHSGRRLPFLLLLAVSLCFMVMWNPFLLVSDASLQLSVLAVLGLYSLIPLFEKYIPERIIPNALGVRDALFATLAAQIMTLPLVLALFERFSVIAPVANIIVAPLTSIAMLLTVLVSIPAIGIFILPFAWFLLSFSLFIAHVLAQLPFADIIVSFPLLLATPAIIILFLGAEYWKRKIEKQVL